jgi:PadR family transcriptional regulator PadR
MEDETPKGHVDLLLLAVLEREPAHGYRIVEALRARSDGVFDLPEGTVYPSLYRLERQGCLTSRWATGAGRKRRVYRLTRSGRRELARRRLAWERFGRAIEAVIG